MIDLLWTGIGGLAGAEAGVVAGWAANRRSKLRPWTRRYLAGLGLALGAAIGAALSLPPVVDTRLDDAGPAFKAIHERYPALYAQMAAAAKGVDPRDTAALQEKLHPILASLIEAHRDEIDDHSAEAVARLMLDETDTLRDSSPQACVAALTGRPAGVTLRSASGPEFRQRSAEVTAAVIEQLAERPQPPPARLSPEEAQRLTGYALDKLTSGDRDTVLPLLQQGRQPSGSREAGAYCAFQRARLSAALDAQPGTLRRLLAS
jgi:hypothetical protein